ncbi:hypothetical protein Gotur_029147 [Gossypium turneri]
MDPEKTDCLCRLVYFLPYIGLWFLYLLFQQYL